MSEIMNLLKSGFTSDNYYKSMNRALMRLNEEYTMLHYPYFLDENEGFYTAQKNLTDHCLSHLPPIKGKRVLEIGCGNGMQAIYVQEKHSPSHLMAIDLNSANIEIARSEAKRLNIKNIEFEVGDAQNLSEIEDDSLDFVINIESGFHYPDKTSFLREISRVLKPGGYFLVADILTKSISTNRIRRFWKKKMNFNHWPKHTYELEIANADLTIHKFSDITSKVIMGFSRYKYWLKNMKRGNYIEDLFLKLFYSINARLNIALLRRRRTYAIFVGTKPL